MNVSFSQGFQDLRLHRILRALKISTGTYVELGFPTPLTSNTERLKRRGWSGVRFDGHCLGNKRDDAVAQCYRAWIKSENIVSLLRERGVADDVTYASIDLDTIDIWVLRAILMSGIRPAVLTVEYNSNYPLEFALAFPDAAHAEDAGPQAKKWDGACCIRACCIRASRCRASTMRA